MQKKDKIDVLLKSLALVGAIISFFVGLHRYKKINEEESVKAFWSQQFPIYKELCISAATIATSHDSLVVMKATDNFWRMYYGDARMVVDWQVHNRMSEYAAILKDVERGFKNRDELTYVSYELATQCRKSISESWRIPLSELVSE